MVVANEVRTAKLAIITSHPPSVSGIIVYNKKVIKNAMIRFYMSALYSLGGSIAKGTALKNNSDLDCVMITKNIKDASQLRAKLPDILCDLKKRLGSSIGVKWKLTFEKQTSFSLQYNMSRFSKPGDTVKVDLLPTFDAKVEGNNGT